MRRVVIESPYAGDVELNLRYLRACMRDCLMRGESPYASHGLYTQPGVLDDSRPDERQLGIEAGFEWRWVAAATVVYEDLGITRGMRAGIADAHAEGGIVEHRKLGLDWDARPSTASNLEQLRQERDALYDALARLVNERKTIEFSTPPQQASMRNARALLAEIQRTPTVPAAELVDQNNKAIEGAPSGYVQINFETQPAASASETPSATRNAFATPSDNLVMEAMRMQSMIACSVVERFPQMMEAAATLLRAADGAGLPAREPRAVVDQDDGDDADETDDDQTESRPTFDINALVAQIAPMIVMALGNGKTKLPGLGELLDWRKAAPTAAPKAKAPKAPRPDGPGDAVASAPEVPENATDSAQGAKP